MFFFSTLGTIFKIIGILLLGILLLLLLLLFLLLFVPLRYRAQLNFGKEGIKVHAGVSYLFRIINVPVDFSDGRLGIKFKVFGLTFYSNAGGKTAKKKKGKKDGEENQEQKPEPESEQTEKAADKDKEIETETEAGLEKDEYRDDLSDCHSETVDLETLKPADHNEDNKPEDGWQDSSSDDVDGDKNPRSLLRRALKIIVRLVERVRAFIKKLTGLFEKARAKLQDIGEKIVGGKLKISDLKGKVGMVFAFFKDEENKNGIKYTGKSIFRLLKHVFPYKIEGDIVFATGDAYTMGRALSALGLIYPLYGKKFHITADFKADRFRLEGDVCLKGRVRFGTVLWIACRLWRKGKIMRLISAAKELKHKLTASAL